MSLRIAIVHNQPDADKYEAAGEAKAVLGVMEEVEAVHQSLLELGYEVSLVPLRPPLEKAIDSLRAIRADVVFNLFEGFDGCPQTEAEVAGTLADLGLPHTGCPRSALALALDKGRAKEALVEAGIETPRYQVLTPETIDYFRLCFPCVVKPCREDASHGMTEDSLVRDQAALERQVRKMCSTSGGESLVEEFVGGREFNVTVLGNISMRVLPPSEIVYSLPGSLPRILTFAAKWEPDSVYFRHTRAVCPAKIGEDLRRRIADIAQRAFKLLGCKGYARVDMRLDDYGDLKVLEVNPNPDISPGTGAARQALASGMTYTGFVEEIVHLALDKVQV